jgi:hypothetical protein
MSHIAFLVPRSSSPYTTIGNAVEYWRAAAPVSVVGAIIAVVILFGLAVHDVGGV